MGRRDAYKKGEELTGREGKTKNCCKLLLNKSVYSFMILLGAYCASPSVPGQLIPLVLGITSLFRAFLLLVIITEIAQTNKTLYCVWPSYVRTFPVLQDRHHVHRH